MLVSFVGRRFNTFECVTFDFPSWGAHILHLHPGRVNGSLLMPGLAQRIRRIHPFGSCSWGKPRHLHSSVGNHASSSIWGDPKWRDWLHKTAAGSPRPHYLTTATASAIQAKPCEGSAATTQAKKPDFSCY